MKGLVVRAEFVVERCIATGGGLRDRDSIAPDDEREGVRAVEEWHGAVGARLRGSREGRVGVEQVDVLCEHGDPRDLDGVLEEREGGELGRVHHLEGREGLVRILWSGAYPARRGAHGGPAATSGVRRVGPSMRSVWQW